MDSPRRSIDTRDPHGHARIHVNILAGWATLFARILAGFIVPRMINDRIGQTELGIWDLSWSVVVYFTLVQGGLISSINRYVAACGGRGDWAGVNRVAGSVFPVLAAMSAVVVLLSVGGMGIASLLLDGNQAKYLPMARWTVLLLGLGIAVDLGGSVFGGVLAGCHRWDLHNGVYGLSHVLTLVAMFMVLSAGHGLIALAAVSLMGEVLSVAIRAILAFRVCPQLSLNPRHYRWETAREMLGFGGKSLVPKIGELLLNQSVGLLIVAYQGPAVLALYSRPRVLVRYLRIFMNKYAMVLVPTVSSLQSSGRIEEITRFVITAMRYSVYVSLPIVIYLIVAGGDILQIWMGTEYRDVVLLTVMALGHFAEVVSPPLFQSLLGLNMHGRPAVATLIAAVAALPLCYMALAVFHWGIVSVSAIVGIALTLSEGVYLPLFLCRKLKIPWLHFFGAITRGPLLCSLPFTAAAIVGMHLGGASVSARLAYSASLSGVALLVCYWLWVIPAQWRQRIAMAVGLKKPIGGKTIS